MSCWISKTQTTWYLLHFVIWNKNGLMITSKTRVPLYLNRLLEGVRNENVICRSRSIHPEMFSGKVDLKIYSKFTGENPCFVTLLKSHFSNGCSPVNVIYSFRTPFPKNTSGWLFLNLGIFVRSPDSVIL